MVSLFVLFTVLLNVMKGKPTTLWELVEILTFLWDTTGKHASSVNILWRTQQPEAQKCLKPHIFH